MEMGCIPGSKKPLSTCCPIVQKSATNSQEWKSNNKNMPIIIIENDKLINKSTIQIEIHRI
jgi:hypothetical protein